jgi:hypothetical protein
MPGARSGAVAARNFGKDARVFLKRARSGAVAARNFGKDARV